MNAIDTHIGADKRERIQPFTIQSVPTLSVGAARCWLGAAGAATQACQLGFGHINGWQQLAADHGGQQLLAPAAGGQQRGAAPGLLTAPALAYGVCRRVQMARAR